MSVIRDPEIDSREEVAAPHEEPPVVLAQTAFAPRVLSVDALRGLTILLMVLVNDLGRGAPSWMHHIQPSTADGMTLADIVFPFFLFIVGLSIPLAQERAAAAGVSRWAELLHILLRSASLLLLGVIEMNAGSDRTLGGGRWEILAFLSVLAAWCALPREPGLKRKLFLVLKVLGALGLVILLALYRRDGGPAELPFHGRVENWVWLRVGWWGILGLIGWAYLTASLLMLWLGRRREWLTGAMAILIMIHLAMRNGGLLARLDTKPWLGATLPAWHWLAGAVSAVGRYISLGNAVGSLAAISVGGCLLGSILRRQSDVRGHGERLRWAGTFCLGLLAAGLVTDTFEGINKNAATPSWCLWSAALACGLWILLYLVMDVAGRTGWSIVVRPAGANPLLAYFLHPLMTGLIGLSGHWNDWLGYKNSHDPRIVVGGSLAMALFVCACTGLLSRLGLRLRL